MLNGKTFVHVYDIDVIDKTNEKKGVCVDSKVLIASDTFFRAPFANSFSFELTVNILTKDISSAFSFSFLFIFFPLKFVFVFEEFNF